MYGTLTGAQSAQPPAAQSTQAAQPAEPARQDADGRGSGADAQTGTTAARSWPRSSPCPSRASAPDELMRVAVLKGGRSLERQVSLRSGARVQDALERLGHEAIPIDVGADLVDQLTAAPARRRVRRAARLATARTGRSRSCSRWWASRTPARGSRRASAPSDKVLAKHAMRDRGIPTPDFYAFNETAFGALGAAQALPAIEDRLRVPDRGQARAPGVGAGDQVRPQRRRRSRRRSSPPSPMTARCCSSATSQGRELAVSILEEDGAPRGAADRRGGARAGGLLRLRGPLRDRAHPLRLPRRARRRGRRAGGRDRAGDVRPARLRRVRPGRPDARDRHRASCSCSRSTRSPG